MASKKFTLLMAMLIFGATAGFSQLGGVLNYHDSTKINDKKLPQFNEWKNNQTPFPPVPRHMAQWSIIGGMNILDGDTPNDFGWHVGGSVRKALGYTFSLRGSLAYGVNKGMDYRKNGFFYNNDAWARYSTNAGGPGYFIANYRTELIMGSLDLVASINNIMFHRAQSKVNAYVFIGYSPFAYNTKIDALDGNRDIYNWEQRLGNSTSFFDQSRKDIKDFLKNDANGFDGTYETQARVNDRRMNFGNSEEDAWQWRHAYSFGGGLEFRLAPRMSLSLEAEYMKTHDDYIDGWYLGEAGALTPEKDNYFLTTLGLNFNF